MIVRVTRMLSINVFKKHPCYKIALRNGTAYKWSDDGGEGKGLLIVGQVQLLRKAMVMLSK